MPQEQIKTLLVNIFTAVIIVGVFVAGYFVFIKKDGVVTGAVTSVSTVARVAEETATIGVEIDSTVRDLKDLSRAVASSTIIFELPEFRNLENFSVTIPTETIGRDNPFVPTIWKLRMKELEESAKKMPTPQLPPSAVETQPALNAGLFGDFSN